MTRTLLFTLPIGVEDPEVRRARGASNQTPEGMNAPDHMLEVPVYVDPDAEDLGMAHHDRDYNGQLGVTET